MESIYSIIIIMQAILVLVQIVIVIFLLSRDTHYVQTPFVALTLLSSAIGLIFLEIVLSKSRVAALNLISLEYYIASYIPFVFIAYVYRMFRIEIPKKMIYYVGLYNILLGNISLTNNYYHLLFTSIDLKVHAHYTEIHLEPGPCYPYFVVGQIAVSVWIVAAFYYFGKRQKKSLGRSKLIISIFIAISILAVSLSTSDPNPRYRIRTLVIGILCVIIFGVLYHYEMFNVMRSAGEVVFGTLKQPIIIVDGNLKLLEYNEAAGKLFPKFCFLKEGERINYIYPELMPIFSNNSNNNDIYLNERIYEGRASKIYHQKRLNGYVVWMLDVTEQRKYMDEQIEMKKQAEAANSAKGSFLSRMSHDMRTPMNAVIGLTEIANRSLDDPKVVEDCLCNVQHSAKYLLALINDILDLSKIESDKMLLNEAVFSLDELMHDIDILIMSQVQQKDIIYKVERKDIVNDSFIGDALRIKQVLMNVISNAIKFTPQDGQVTVTIKEQVVDEKQSILQFNVEDTGIGMSDGKMKVIFKPFEQGDNTTQTKYGGSGLGLSISKQLLVLMNGKIEVESELGKGSLFKISIPLEVKGAEKKDSVSTPATYNFEGRRVLLVEDNEMNIEVSKMILLMQNLRVEIAENGLSAVNMFRSAPDYYYDYILMDIRMPVMDGLEATRKIRSLNKEDAKTIPIIAMTANAYKKDIDEVKMCGMNEHLEKPIDVKKVIECLKKYKKEGEA